MQCLTIRLMYENKRLTLLLSQGKKNPGTDGPSVVSFLKQVILAKKMKIDRY